MSRHNTNIYFPEITYQKLRNIIGERISNFVSEAVEEKLTRIEKEKKMNLNSSYQRIAQNQNVRKEAKIWEGSIEDGI